MECRETCHEAHPGGRWLDEGLQAERDQELIDRQAAVMYLHAAGLTDDPRARAMLRRRGVQLLTARPGGFRLSRAC